MAQSGGNTKQDGNRSFCAFLLVDRLGFIAFFSDFEDLIFWLSFDTFILFEFICLVGIIFFDSFNCVSCGSESFIDAPAK